MKKKLTKAEIVLQLKNIGVKSGDVIFLAADLLRVGYFNKNREQTLVDWVDALKESVGNDGTLVIPAYTKTFFIWKKDAGIFFNEFSPTTSGSLSAAFQNYPSVKRSKHPTNSCFAIGNSAEYILDGHDEMATSYLPYSRIIELGGKNLMIGAFSDVRLAPMAMHFAQEYIGFSKRHWAAGLLQTYFIDQQGAIRLFTRHDVGGCTAGGYKVIGHHLIANAINFGKVGGASAALIDCSKSMEIFVNVLKNNPGLVRCDNQLCPDCYGSPIKLHLMFWFRFICIRLAKRLAIKRRYS
jgi:aminoglycoside 3-N-acetyltransferase